MISDEMRELLSAYVDGELRDADAARVEDVSKRDPELRREIESYRTLRRKLREWDAAEHGAVPAPTLVPRTVARARAMDEMLAAAPARLRFLAPLGVAASLLVAAGAGFFLARSAPSLPAPREVASVKLAPAPDLALEGSALVPATAPAAATVRVRIDDHIPSRRALEFEDAMREGEMVRAKPPPPEPGTRTVTPMSAEIITMMEGYAAAAEPSDALVVISRAPALRALEPVGAATGRARDPSEGRIMSKLEGSGPAVVAPLGEVWVGTDSTRRTRVVAASDWVTRNAGTLLAVVWADDIGTPETTTDVEVQDFILGPKARQRLLAAKTGHDAEFVAWLRDASGAQPLPALFGSGAKDRDRAVNKLVEALARDKAATGFALLDARGRVLGTELFHNHGLMLAFAPRLLRGYLVEAGEDGVRIAPPRVLGHGQDAVGKLIEGMPARGLRVERQGLDVPFDELDKSRKTKHAPDGVARVTLYAASGEAVGHGLVVDGTPIHLTLFGE